MYVYIVAVAADPHWAHTVIGLWVICGILSFMAIEKVFGEGDDEEEEAEAEENMVRSSFPSLCLNSHRDVVNGSTCSIDQQAAS